MLDLSATGIKLAPKNTDNVLKHELGKPYRYLETRGGPLATWANIWRVEEGVKSESLLVMSRIDKVYRPERVPTYTYGDLSTRLETLGLADNEDERDGNRPGALREQL